MEQEKQALVEEIKQFMESKGFTCDEFKTDYCADYRTPEIIAYFEGKEGFSIVIKPYIDQDFENTSKDEPLRHRSPYAICNASKEELLESYNKRHGREKQTFEPLLDHVKHESSIQVANIYSYDKMFLNEFKEEINDIIVNIIKDFIEKNCPDISEEDAKFIAQEIGQDDICRDFIMGDDDKSKEIVYNSQFYTEFGLRDDDSEIEYEEDYDEDIDEPEVYHQICDMLYRADSLDELGEIAFGVFNSLTFDSITPNEFEVLLKDISFHNECSEELKNAINETINNSNSLPLKTYLWKNVPAFKEDEINSTKDYIIRELIDNSNYETPDDALCYAKFTIDRKEKTITFETDFDFGPDEETGELDLKHYEGKITCNLPGELDIIIKELREISPIMINDDRTTSGIEEDGHEL